jgi:hypothetical protein
MALTVEDGTGMPDANSWLSAADADTLLNNMPVDLTAWDNVDDPEKILVAAARYLTQNWRFYGAPMTDAQVLPYPRTKNWDENGRLIAPGTIPVQLKLAQALVALELAKDPEIIQDDTGTLEGVKSWSLGGLSMTLSDTEKANNTGIPMPVIVNLLRPIAEPKSAAPTFGQTWS